MCMHVQPHSLNDFQTIACVYAALCQLVAPYLNMSAGVNYTAILDTFNGLCDAYNKALIQVCRCDTHFACSQLVVMCLQERVSV